MAGIFWILISTLLLDFKVILNKLEDGIFQCLSQFYLSLTGYLEMFQKRNIKPPYSWIQVEILPQTQIPLKRLVERFLWLWQLEITMFQNYLQFTCFMLERSCVKWTVGGKKTSDRSVRDIQCVFSSFCCSCFLDSWSWTLISANRKKATGVIVWNDIQESLLIAV